ncbi:bifunctional 3,4-dihydroxy-2-butanone-4-phosphate synthase/GTP cyclohydrolase II [Nocardia nova]|uniref:GTP cyclohydrolase II n=1 Tax=Nocardia nova TaxID=37330 RepID=UPI000CE9AE1C|nr:GTP cyclohydrolase II [Nocardia nova]PPJ14436.1 bifunctional 3,4-dihydroxy-2-butanone-4-phosphate synthase/GTP cyclohydrolase II [Nocardia nova]
MTTRVESSVASCLRELRAGRPIVVLDDATRENEADLVLAAEHANEDAVAFFLEHTSGFLCVAMPETRLAELDLPLMVTDPTDPLRTAFTVSVDAADGVTTGISAADRARTARLLACATTRPRDLTRPGHMMPLRARGGGVLERRGHTEAAVDLCTAAGLNPAGMICELVGPGRRTMMSREQAYAFADEHGLAVLTVDELVSYRRRSAVVRCAHAELPTEYGLFDVIVYRSVATGIEHVALVHGDLTASRPVVRVHSECLTGDTFGSQRCDCGAQLRAAMRTISASECGAVIYLGGHEGRGIGLAAKIAAYRLQDTQGLDTVDANLRLGFPADSRDYREAAAILDDLGVDSVRLLTNNPDKVAGLTAAGTAVVAVEGLVSEPNPHNSAYLSAKRDRMGHRIIDTVVGPASVAAR